MIWKTSDNSKQSWITCIEWMDGQDEVEGFGINRRTESGLRRNRHKSASQKKQSTSTSCRRNCPLVDFASIISTLAISYSQVTIVSTMLRIS